MKYIVSIFTIAVLILPLHSQTTDSTWQDVPFVIKNGDTIYQARLKDINLYINRDFPSKWDERKYWRLVANLKKVYPYAKLAAKKLEEMNEKFLTMESEKERKNYAKQVEKDIRANFENDLKNLTVTQGKLLIKLIDRETGHTTYELLKELRGNLSAVFWQTLARIFGHNLKTEYDGAGTDKIIEEILVAIDDGFL